MPIAFIVVPGDTEIVHELVGLAVEVFALQ
jgi:hypothetical protein